MSVDPGGEHPAAHATATPDRVALVMAGSGQAGTYRQIDEASTRLALVLWDRGLRPGDHLAEELIAYCRERLSHFKGPRSVHFVDDLPRLPTGKLLKRLLLRAP